MPLEAAALKVHVFKLSNVRPWIINYLEHANLSFSQPLSLSRSRQPMRPQTTTRAS